MRPPCRIALLEDNDVVIEVVRQALQEQGVEVVCFTLVADLCAALRVQAFDLLLLDWSLPDGQADGVIKLVREELRLPVPILIQSVMGNEDHVAEALLMGANDYVTKPLRVRELQARVAVLLRDRKPEPIAPDALGYRFDDTNKRLTLKGQALDLTALEYDLAYYLFSNRNRLLSRELLLKDVWQQTTVVDTRTVDAFVSRLRKKLLLDEVGAIQVRSVRGYGYRLEVPEAATHP